MDKKPKAINVTTFMADMYGDLLKADANAAALDIVTEYRRLAVEIQEAGQFADNYHTFDELYQHRVRLFVCLMHAHKSRAWWSFLHSDGTQWKGWVIAGIDTPAGSATYHLPESAVDDLPVCTNIARGKEWDGHTADDVLERLTSLFGCTEPQEEPETVVYHYAASVNMARGPLNYDGIVTGPAITGIDDYLKYRAEIAADANVQPEQVQVHSMAIVSQAGHASQMVTCEADNPLYRLVEDKE